MYFVDNSGHIFELPDYNKKPIGYEYDEQDYIFWFNDYKDNTRLSVNNYYGKIINVLFELSNIKDLDNTNISSIYDVEIICDSENFKLVRAIDFQNAIRENTSILEYCNSIEQSKILSSQNNENDILVIKVNQDEKNYMMIPVYIIGTSQYAGTWLTNVLIHISNKLTNTHTWCPITIGGIFNDEYESLIIHGKNMGIDLPKDILKAINGTSIYNDVFDEELYNKKIKEYLLNYMNIKGELGNYNSAINALKWFGYNKTIELYKLLETDNQFQTQYVRDYFNIKQDIIKAFSHFLNSQFIGLKYKLNTETGELEKQNVKDVLISTLWGEGLPLLTEFDGKYKMVYTDEYLDQEYEDKTEIENSNQQFKYSSPYLNYTIYDLMFKLSYLKYYYQTYFLPIFLILKNIHIEYKVYANPNKYLTYTYNHFYEQIINTQNDDVDVIFDQEHIKYFTHQRHLVDKLLNEFENNEDTYEIHDTCLFIPIKFKQNKYYNCILVLKDDDLNKIIYKSNFSFINKENNQYKGFVFYPKIIDALYNINLYTYANKNYILYLNVNNTWYEYKFKTKLHELDVHIGTLKYRYWVNDINYFNEKFHAYDNNASRNTNKVIFRFEKEQVELDITNYIFHKDFFDYPTKYFSNFNQIDYIDDERVHFNIYMHHPDFIYTNNLNFGIYQQELEDNITESINQEIEQLVNQYQLKVNLISNYKYLNNVHMYYIYEQNVSKGFDILRYKINLSVLCDKFLIEQYYNTDENAFEFKCTNISMSSVTETDEEINHYLLDHDVCSLEYGDPVYYFILERDIHYNFTGNNAKELYTYYDNKTQKYDIGYIICPIVENQLQFNDNDLHNNQYVYNLNSGYNVRNIHVENNYIYYKDNDYEYIVNFTFESLVKSVSYADEHAIENYSPYNHDTYEIGQQLYAKLNLFYYEKIKVLNVFGYYNDTFCTNLNEDNLTCTVDFTKVGLNIDPINNVKLHLASKLVTYKDVRYTDSPLLHEENPSLYWITFDENNTNFDSLLNTFIDLDIHHSVEELENEQPKYINYLCQDITGLKGKYKLEVEGSSDIRLCVDIDEVKHYNTDNNGIIELTGNENKVLVYFEFDSETTDTFIFKPHIWTVIETFDKEIPYNPEITDAELIDLYSQFFYKKYSITIKNNTEILHKKEIWDSFIQLDENSNYDTYLMHDKDIWYFMFISKNTCDDPNILNILNVYPDTIEFGKYILKHVVTKQLFLINRMDINYVDNIYHFDGNDMIVCSLYNNKMLPHNMNISSKWKLTPVSFKANTDVSIYAKTNTAIISINNNNSYDKGYYNLQIMYSLDPNTLNYQQINKKILIS